MCIYSRSFTSLTLNLLPTETTNVEILEPDQCTFSTEKDGIDLSSVNDPLILQIPTQREKEENLLHPFDTVGVTRTMEHLLVGSPFSFTL